MAYGDLLNKKRQPQFGLPNLGGGDIRETPDPPFIGTPSGATEYGQGSGVIGQGGIAGTFADMFANTVGGMGMGYEVESLTDLYDLWTQGYFGGGPQGDYDSFVDWLNNWGGSLGDDVGWGSYMDFLGRNEGLWEEGDIPYMDYTPGSGGPVGDPNSPFYGLDPGASGAGSQIGGMGDVGTGSTWFGGGILGEGLWDYDCAQMGPSYGPNGECLACCDYAELSEEDQSWGEYYGATESELDPDFDDDCWGMWEQAEAAGFQGEYDDFANLYCG